MSEDARSDQQIIGDAGLYLSEINSDGDAFEYRISGDTHPYRRILRDLGGKWDKVKQNWKFSVADPTPELAEAILKAPPPDETDKKAKDDNKPHYWGHRQRLRDRFMEQGANALADYELLELLLFYSIPRKDVKPLAKKLIDTFGGLDGVFAADPDRLAEVDTITYQTIVELKAIKAAAGRLGQAEIAEQPVLSSWNKLIRYLKSQMAHDMNEQFRIVFLNTKNMVIADEVQQQGTVNHTPVYPREVIKRALELGATALIMVHNHPSGDPTPSQADIDMTLEISEAGEKLGIVLHDHIVISKRGHSSFKEMGLI
ncbi:MAG: DNA repair protein RadC [Rhodospirillaceae bacterium]|jgi:DNA repair protein RadC|nr:DNA repair protein RadC [Rhodospirillaceae bacterium]